MKAFGFAVIFCIAGGLYGQETSPPGFEVAAIRPNSDNGPQRLNLFPQFTAHNVTLKDLFLLAYDVRGFQISGGPAWFSSDRYDITTKMASTPAPGPDAMMLQRRRVQLLLQDRFKLAVHHETKDLPIYELTAGKGGAKLKPPACSESGKMIRDSCGFSGFFKGRFEASSATTGDFVKALSNLLERTVVDKTGLNGTFRIVLTFAVDDGTRRFPDAPPDAPIDADGPGAYDTAPNIFTAIQEQLGLRLEPGRGPGDVMVIDRVEKPSDN